MPPRKSRAERIWLDPENVDFDQFVTLTQRTAVAEEYPLADRIEKNAPIYNGEMIRSLEGAARKELMAEWAEVFDIGPGIVVIEGAFADMEPVDKATRIFESLIDQERAAGLSAADHFAKPGANDRVWNVLEKHCIADPESFALYYGNTCIATVAEAWLGPNYQVTAQVNRVNPGGKAQSAHRDYHLGFMTPQQAAQYPAHVQTLSPALTLQGAVAHCDMPLESGPTMYLPFSQLFFEGYVAFSQQKFQDYFAEHHVQLPLKKGDAVFFNPALMHGAGTNISTDILRMANLLQISSAFGRALEAVDRTRMCREMYPTLSKLAKSGRFFAAELDAAIAATAEGYPFPTNLDRDPPEGGLAPKSQQAHMSAYLAAGKTAKEFEKQLEELERKRLTN